jgi:hypothetical protein
LSGGFDSTRFHSLLQDELSLRIVRECERIGEGSGDGGNDDGGGADGGGGGGHLNCYEGIKVLREFLPRFRKEEDDRKGVDEDKTNNNNTTGDSIQNKGTEAGVASNSLPQSSDESSLKRPFESYVNDPLSFDRDLRDGKIKASDLMDAPPFMLVVAELFEQQEGGRKKARLSSSKGGG